MPTWGQLLRTCPQVLDNPAGCPHAPSRDGDQIIPGTTPIYTLDKTHTPAQVAPSM